MSAPDPSRGGGAEPPIEDRGGEGRVHAGEDRMVVDYDLLAADVGEAAELGRFIAREQTLEVPPGVAGDAIEQRLLGRVEEVAPLGRGRFRARISYSVEVTGLELPQILNVAYGNVSLMNGVRVADLGLPGTVLDRLPGPRHGVEGLRALVGAEPGRPLVSVALKPVGRTTAELARLAGAFARAGADAIKDDHGVVDQPPSRFAERVEVVAAAVAEANAATGGRCLYLPNVTGPAHDLEERLDRVARAGCAGVMLCPGLTGLDAMRAVADGTRPLAIMAHPSHAQTAPGRTEGFAPHVLLGTLYRVAGADACVYVNAEGRFPWPVEACELINARLRAPMPGIRPAFPVPAGGVAASDAGRWLDRYGPDTMLLIGGSLLSRSDVEGATRRVVEAAHAFAGKARAGRARPEAAPS